MSAPCWTPSRKKPPIKKNQHAIRIDESPEKVWRVLADLESVQHYNHTVTKARYISPNREGLGAGRECEVKPKGKIKERSRRRPSSGEEPENRESMDFPFSDRSLAIAVLRIS